MVFLPCLVLLGCARAAASSAATDGASTLKYFGVWDLEQADPVADDVKDFANFLFTSSDITTINK